MRLIVAITGASGSIYGIKLLEELKKRDLETHLIMTDWAKSNIVLETDYSVAAVAELASHVHENDDFRAAVASGSFKTTGMVIAPCSMRTLAAVASGLADNLISRSADVIIKEQRKLILVPRETPLSAIHLENMLKLARIGAVIMPPVAGFYQHPTSIEEVVNQLVSRILDQLHLDNQLVKRWGEETDGL